MSEVDVAAWAGAACARARKGGYRVRTAVPEDAAAIAEVHVQVWRTTYQGLMRAEVLAGLDPAARTEGWRRLLGEQDRSVRTCVGLDVGGTLVGFASAGSSRDETPVAVQELYAIYVLQAAQGSGVAHLLMDAVLVPGPSSLWVAVGNERADAFYRRYGFADDGATQVDERLGVTEKRMVRGSFSP